MALDSPIRFQRLHNDLVRRLVEQQNLIATSNRLLNERGPLKAFDALPSRSEEVDLLLVASTFLNILNKGKCD